MAGNVWEWCLNKHNPPENTALASAAERVVRGGAWDSDEDYARCASRYDWYPSYRNDDLGFRVCVASRPIF